MKFNEDKFTVTDPNKLKSNNHNNHNNHNNETNDNSDLYNYVDVKNKENQFIFVSNFDSLKTYEKELGTKKKFMTALITTLLFLQLIVHSYIAYASLKDCRKRVKSLVNNYEITKNYKEETDLKYSYICASYIRMYIFISYYIKFINLSSSYLVEFGFLYSWHIYYD